MAKLNQRDELSWALANLLEWAKGLRGTRRGNPYLVPEVAAALTVLAKQTCHSGNVYEVPTDLLSQRDSY